MPKRSLGATLLAGGFFVAGLAGLYPSWAAWPRTAGTSPLMALLALAWGLTSGGELVIPAMVVLTLVAVIGVRYLRGLRRAAA